VVQHAQQGFLQHRSHFTIPFQHFAAVGEEESIGAPGFCLDGAGGKLFEFEISDLAFKMNPVD